MDQSNLCGTQLSSSRRMRRQSGVASSNLHTDLSVVIFIITVAKSALRCIKGEQAPRAPVDDLESFVWVLLYELLYWAPNRTLVEITWWNLLNTDGVTKMSVSKRAILYDWQVTEPELPPCLSRCGGLLRRWLACVLTKNSSGLWMCRYLSSEFCN